MNSFIEYSLKTGISLVVLYLFYWIVLRKDTHLMINRAVLLLSLIISIVLPLVSFFIVKIPIITESLPVSVIDFGASALPVDTVAITSKTTSLTSSFWKTISIIYITGAVIVFVRLIYQAIFIKAISRLSKKTRHNGYTIISMSTEMVPFSYFKRIFIPESKMDDSSFDNIIAHERSHLIQWHYADLIIVEIITVLQWFNPIVWFYEKSIKEVHEYLADEAVLNMGKNQGIYQALLVNQAIGGPVFILTNQFNQSLIKKRIIMMTKSKTPRAAKLKALLLMPLVSCLLLAFASPQIKGQPMSDGKQITVSGKVTEQSTGNAVSGCTVCIKGTTIGTVADEHGNYEITVNGSSDVLVFTFVGLRTVETGVQSNSIINVQMEPDIYQLDFSKGNTLIKDEAKGKNSGSEPKEVFVVVEELPGYPGGTDALHEFLIANLNYPEKERANGIGGRVIVTFIINSEGVVTDAKILRGISPDIDKEALRLTCLLKGWSPARQAGKPISMAINLPIDFIANK